MDRVTNQTMAATAQRNLQASLQQMARLQEQGSSQKRILTPSDDPRGTADVIAVRSQQRAAEQHGRNIDNGTGWLTTVDSALGNATDILQSALQRTLQGANDGALGQEAKNALAIEIDGLRDALLKEANATYLGRSVFAGSSDAGRAFSDAGAEPPYAWTGTPGRTVDRKVAEGVTVRVDADGAAAFGEGEASVFALLDGIAADLRAGTPVSGRIDAVRDALDGVIAAHATVGAQHGQLQRAESVLKTTEVDLEAQRSKAEDIDLAKVILDLNVQSTVYQAALNVTARVLQPSLMDFLR
ncbi:flagellar hook-associated protein FlgL [Arenivirga flava]|uniref:Flagellar hook-associated protein FlgL n=1 Tax=Arenivirga flava TaxID=1930060 RepID=A0AA37XB10_9MICO|nr:flagellar hook-associated protein FlgL [Arenivirga flava]GMA27856.1 flagellar hook-associated protein FlgL [Arenivirga flava]